MKIRTRLWISAVFIICIVITIGLTISFMSQQVNEAYERHNVVDEIVEGAFNINILTGDFLTHQEERVIIQWHLVHDSLSKHLTEIDLKNQEEQSVLDRINQNLENTDDLFSQLVEHF